MYKNHPLNQKVNFIISVVFIGSVALLAIVTMLNASDESENPIANAVAVRVAEIEEPLLGKKPAPGN